MRLLVFIFTFFLTSQAYAEPYNREAFRHWIDADGDGKNTRMEEIQRATVIGIVCPYTGELITNPGNADIDHVIPLKWAWEHGAERWTPEQRENFANDPVNLLPVVAAVNRAKGAKGPDEWLPPNGRFVPEYCFLWLVVCQKYALECDVEMLQEIREKYGKVHNGIRPEQLNL